MIQRPSTGQFRAKKYHRIKRSIQSLLTVEQMNLAIQRESLRVDRKNGSALVLVLFRLNGRAHARWTVRLVKTLLRRIRITDDLGWFDDKHIGALLPDTSPAGAWRLSQWVCDRVGRRGQRPHVVMYNYSASPADSVARPSIIRHTDLPIMPTARAG